MEEKKANQIEEVFPKKELKNEKVQAEKRLCLLEKELKKLIREKKRIKDLFKKKFKEVNSWFEKQWKEATKLENQMILLWDYWQREVEILSLQKQIQNQVLATDRQEKVKKLDQLITLNASLEKGFKQRQIDPQLMETLRKKIGAWEEKES